MYRYVFYRLDRLQRRKISDPREADLTALIFMSLTPMALQAAVDILSSKVFGTMLLIERIGKWPYSIGVFGVIYLIHYWWLGNRHTIAKIHDEFEATSAHGRWGTVIVLAYFIVPFLLLGVSIAI